MPPLIFPWLAPLSCSGTAAACFLRPCNSLLLILLASQDNVLLILHSWPLPHTRKHPHSPLHLHHWGPLPRPQHHPRKIADVVGGRWATGFASQEVFQHSSAHVLGYAMEDTLGCLLTTGPPLEDGSFFYEVPASAPIMTKAFGTTPFCIHATWAGTADNVDL